MGETGLAVGPGVGASRNRPPFGHGLLLGKGRLHTLAVQVTTAGIYLNAYPISL